MSKENSSKRNITKNEVLDGLLQLTALSGVLGIWGYMGGPLSNLGESSLKMVRIISIIIKGLVTNNR
jgi:hypothetical protein